MNEQEQRGADLSTRLRAAGYTLGSTTTADALEAFLIGEPSPLQSFNGVLLTKEDWVNRYVKHMTKNNAATESFARASAEIVFASHIWGSYLPEDAADVEMNRWGN